MNKASCETTKNEQPQDNHLDLLEVNNKHLGWGWGVWEREIKMILPVKSLYCSTYIKLFGFCIDVPNSTSVTSNKIYIKVKRCDETL